MRLQLTPAWLPASAYQCILQQSLFPWWGTLHTGDQEPHASYKREHVSVGTVGRNDFMQGSASHSWEGCRCESLDESGCACDGINVTLSLIKSYKIQYTTTNEDERVAEC